MRIIATDENKPYAGPLPNTNALLNMLEMVESFGLSPVFNWDHAFTLAAEARKEVAAQAKEQP